MNIEDAYNKWAEQYDTNENKTRDLEAISLRENLSGYNFNKILETGCGTGKNTQWLQSICTVLIAVDFSEKMLAVAKKKIWSDHVQFYKADINKDWDFITGTFDLITFSLMLEHIADLEPVFQKANSHLKPGGKIYISELHPAKQYTGSKARFETESGTETVRCYTHHLSDFTAAARQAGLEIEMINEYFDEDNRESIPRLLTMIFMKPDHSSGKK